MATGQVTRDESVPAVPRPGDYYRKAVSDDIDAELPVGELVLIVSLEGDELEFVSGEDSYTCDVASFSHTYTFAPDGEEERAAEMRELRAEIKGLQREAHAMRGEYESLTNAQIGVPAPPQMLSGLPQEKSQTAAIQVGEPEQSISRVAAPTNGTLASGSGAMANLVAGTKLGAATVRNRINVFLNGVEARRSRLNALLKEQEAALDALNGLKKIMRAAEKLIAVLNVYLGHDEEIIQLLDGEPAPVDEKISVRQLVLHMDEECAIASEEGGIDWASLGQFDDWLKVPEHLQQVLPEPRGMVAIKPRRKDKDYGDDSLVNAIFNTRNKKTYFLLRNGERLFRICSTVEVGSNLFPTSTEFDELFYGNEYDYDARKYKRVQYRPGSASFARAMEEADDLARAYGTVLLMLQGLIDRTEVFQPLPGEAVNVMDRANHESYIRYVYDAEKVLTTGRPSFIKWQRDLNAKLDVGHRIIGIFDAYSSGLQYDREGKCSRLWPERANRPKNLTLHTIERRDRDEFVFLYDRHETVWPRSRYESSRESKVRASCKVQPSDSFILNYDLAEVEDMRFFLSNRIDRGDYVSMFPLLKTCIKLKEQEASEEKPFRTLLVGQIMRQHKVALDEAEARVDELIKWYKLKNHVHRALLEDDGKALRMIVKEFGLAMKRDAERAASQSVEAQIVEQIRAANQETFYIGHRKANIYVALVPENNENIFVKEQDWLRDTTTGAMTLKDEHRWRVVDQRRLRWTPLWTGERWEAWVLDARRRQFLTDDERAILIPQIWAEVERREAHWRDRQTGAARQQSVCWPLALTLSVDHESFYAWYADKKALVPRSTAKCSERDGIRSPNLSRMNFSWKRTRTGDFTLLLEAENNCSYEHSRKEIHRPWRDNVVSIQMSANFGVGQSNHGKLLLWEDEEAAERFNNEWKRMKAGYRMREQFNEAVRRAGDQVEAAMLKKMQDEARSIYDRDHGAPELWDEHLERLKLREPHAEGFRKAVARVLREGGQVDGQSVEAIVERAAALGVEIKAKEHVLLPLDFVIDFKRADVEEDEEE